MHYNYLGRTGLQVSRLGLGTMNFGMVTDETTAFGIMDDARDAGINYFDTADVYGGPQKPDIEKGYGVSEEIIGRWLAQGGRREHVVLATKVYQPMDNVFPSATLGQPATDKLFRYAIALFDVWL